ncbi:MAG: lytic murein transglycosylase [Microbacteriaceae bacterium]|uniref:lytic transglycosylase domain-containing protein n=1 Tax=Microbacterium sp. TaxID=51671 RepID=UPI003F94711E
MTGIREDDEFTALWESAPDAAQEEDLLPPVPGRRSAGLMALVVLCGCGGFITIALAVLLLVTGQDSPAPAVDPSPAIISVPVESAPTDAPSPTPDPASMTPAPVTGLADPRWVARVSDASGIPARALDAYAGAAIAVSDVYPRCGLGWNTLAAIGLVESDHGAAQGAVLGGDGVVSPSIVGIALDGTASAHIADTDGGRLDGDQVWDRAVGPMQFIPGTWEIYGRDGNADGRRDPDQIDDAALAAAHYLCDVGGDLTVAQNWITAVADYNPNIDYNHRVAEAADVYAAYG